MTEEMVDVWDFESKTKTRIPARELAPGMTRVFIADVGEVWVNVKELRGGPLRHGAFPESVRALIRRLQEVFAEVYTKSFEEWEEGFRRDTNWGKEIELWLRMANVYQHFTEGRLLDREQKQHYFSFILACANNGPDKAHLTCNPRTLSQKRKKEIADWFSQLPLEVPDCLRGSLQKPVCR
jgi:hypothetical protein